jgi:hypothetical protein
MVVTDTAKLSSAQTGHLCFLGVVPLEAQQSVIIIYQVFSAIIKAALFCGSQHNFYIVIASVLALMRLYIIRMPKHLLFSKPSYITVPVQYETLLAGAV